MYLQLLPSVLYYQKKESKGRTERRKCRWREYRGRTESKAAIAAAQRKAVLEQQTTETEVAKREAERTIIQAQAEAQAMRMAGLTEAEIMRAKGYNEKDVLQADVQKAYAAGLGQMGSGGGQKEYHVVDFLIGGEGYLQNNNKTYLNSDINLGDLIVYENWQKQ